MRRQSAHRLLVLAGFSVLCLFACAAEGAEEDISPEDLDSINSIVSDTKIVKALHQEAEIQTKNIEELQGRLENDLKLINNMITETLNQVRASQAAHEARTKAVEEWVGMVNVHARAELDAKHSPLRTWALPFLAVLLAMVGFAVYSSRALRQLIDVDMVFNRQKRNLE